MSEAKEFAALRARAEKNAAERDEALGALEALLVSTTERDAAQKAYENALARTIKALAMSGKA